MGLSHYKRYNSYSHIGKGHPKLVLFVDPTRLVIIGSCGRPKNEIS